MEAQSQRLRKYDIDWVTIIPTHTDLYMIQGKLHEFFLHNFLIMLHLWIFMFSIVVEGFWAPYCAECMGILAHHSAALIMFYGR